MVCQQYKLKSKYIKPKSLEPNKLPFWQSVTKHNLLVQSLQIKAIYKIMPTKHKFNSNYYPSVARVDSSLIESTCIFLETLKQNA